ncbi:MAG: hypothetical protein A2W27_04745 [Deltaproteobacteria bacterium RBG_16_44_11]|nr:MAG: hypothetical protein A2W27_04745 [Deltaproteobacteria bacterium RBG_16_44_11]
MLTYPEFLVFSLSKSQLIYLQGLPMSRAVNDNFSSFEADISIIGRQKQAAERLGERAALQEKFRKFIQKRKHIK